MRLHLGGQLEGAEKRFWREKWFWRFLTLVVLVMAIFFSRLWAIISIVYLAVVSNYALDLTASGAEQAARAARSAVEGEDAA